MDPAIMENLNYGWSPQDPSKTLRLKVILPQFYAALAIFAVNLSHEIFGSVMFIVVNTEDFSSFSYILYRVMLGIGLLIGGIVAHFTGARAMVMLAGTTSLVGWIILGWISSVTVLQWTLHIVAFSKGMMQAPAYVYLAEISQPNMRNVLMAAMCLSSDIGSIYLTLADVEHTRIAAFVNVILALFGVVVTFSLPDSPYWLANKRRYHVIESSLAWFRGRTTPENVKSESQAIIRNAQNSPTAFKLFFKQSLYLPALVVCSVFLANAFVRIFYVSHFIRIYTILYDLKYRHSLSLVWGLSTVYISVAFVVLVAIFGKRILVLISLFVGSMAVLAASIAGYLNGNNILSKDVYLWFLLICLSVAYASRITGVVSVPLILNGELFPSKLRNLGAGFGLFFAYVVQAVSNNLYSMYFDSVNGALLALALVSIFGFILLYWLFPKNENKSLVEIENSSTDLLKSIHITYIRVSVLSDDNSNPNLPSIFPSDMNPASIENLNYGWSAQAPLPTRRLKVILPQCYATLAIFALNLSHAIFEHTLYRDVNSVNAAIDAYVFMTVLGLLVGGIVAQITGPRAIIRLAGAVSIVGWTTLGWIPSKNILHWTIYIVALAAGMMQAPCFVYLAEISQPNMRCALMAIICVLRNFGSFYLNLRDLGSIGIIALANLFLAFFGLVLMFILPESPYWLANKGHCHGIESAKSSLAWFRGRTSVENVQSESQAIINNAQNSPTAYQLFWRKALYIRALIVGYVFITTVSIRIFVTMNYHYQIIWTNLVSTYKVYLVISIITVLLSIAFVVLVAIIGKRILILISSYFGSIAILVASTFGYLNEDNFVNEDVYSWFLLICLAVAYFSIILGIVPIPLILNGELFPSKIRNVGAGFGLFFGHVVQMVLNKVYLKYFRYAHGPELALALISMFGFISLFWLFPRHENKSLVEIEQSSISINELRREK